ncbi:hypothetical protein [Chitinilyticum aquatile]|uniref:hypothetical protein n=1 Tax=Chitinilyticum aquatile TaxID=362520 RepID=UPI00040D0927|nr:hypothetical protein [Chitinilyticum aquatile]
MNPTPQQVTQQLLDWPEPDLRTLLRQLEHTTLRDALWLLRSLPLLQTIVAQLSPAAARLLLDDLEQTWWGCNPLRTSAAQQRQGEQALTQLYAVMQKLPAGAAHD